MILIFPVWTFFAGKMTSHEHKVVARPDFEKGIQVCFRKSDDGSDETINLVLTVF